MPGYPFPIFPHIPEPWVVGRAPRPARVPPDPLPIISAEPLPMTDSQTQAHPIQSSRRACVTDPRPRTDLRDASAFHMTGTGHRAASRRGSACRPFLKPVSDQTIPHHPRNPPNLTEPPQRIPAPQSHIDPDPVPVLEPIAHRLSSAVHLPAHALHRVRLNAHRERLPGDPHRRPRHNRPMRLPIESIRISCGCCVVSYGRDEQRPTGPHRETVVLGNSRVSQDVDPEPARCARLTS